MAPAPAPAPTTPRRTATGRRRGRPPGTTNAARAARLAAASSEPPAKKRKYIPGGPGGGGRFVDENGNTTDVVRRVPGSVPSRAPKTSTSLVAGAAASPIYPRRERSTRTRSAVNRYEPDDEEQFGSAAAVAAAVVQSEGYKPREERGWEEFHPNLDIETMFMVFRAEDVDGTAPAAAPTPTAQGTSSAFGVPSTSFASAPGPVTPSRNNSISFAGVGVVSPSVNGAVSTDAAPEASGLNGLGGADGTGAAHQTGAAAAAVAADLDIHGSPIASSNGGAVATPQPITPLRRRIGRPPRDVVSMYSSATTPKTPKVLPIHNQTPKEKLDLKLPSYRKTDRILLFESKTYGRYVDKSMMNVGYQESDIYIRPERLLLKASDANAEEDMDSHTDGGNHNHGHGHGHGHSHVHMSTAAGSNGGVGRVEYDMDEQDDQWLAKYNTQRKAVAVEPITREMFEIAITKIEKEWHALEKRIPKPNPKPPQTHRPRSSSAAAVNGETQGSGEEQDSKCAICDDGDCENTNAIVFCDGCDLAVHQDCYGVPFIPEGQWLCRKCQLIGRGIPTCIFCPNTDGAFKQTNSSKWAHMLCAMWIPETSLGNTTFMEPVMDVDKVPKTRWKLTCYICRQKMGACIQCGNKACYQAFHVTCARRAHLYLKMKNSQGALAVLDNSMILKAFCDRHCPPDYAKEHSVHQATKDAKRFYKRTMRGRIWADSRASAMQLAASRRGVTDSNPADASQMAGAHLNAIMASGAASAAAAAAASASATSAAISAATTGNGSIYDPSSVVVGSSTSESGDSKKKAGGAATGAGGVGQQPSRPMWKLPSGAPVIPQAVFDIVETALQRFMLRRRREFVSEACRYWTLKREARRGAALLKRLQLQMETFTSMELTRRNFATMGPSGQTRLERRIEFAEKLISDLEQLKALADDVVQREHDKLTAADLELDFVNTCYFPIYQLLAPVVEKASTYDKNVFRDGLATLQAKLDERFYTNTLSFVHDLCDSFHKTINREPEAIEADAATDAGGKSTVAQLAISAPKVAVPNAYAEARDRKRLGKRILKSIQPMLEKAIRAESDITHVPVQSLLKELEEMLESCVELQQTSITVSQAPSTRGGSAALSVTEDVAMVDVGSTAAEEDYAGQIVVAKDSSEFSGDASSGQTETSTAETQESEAAVENAITDDMDLDAEGEPDPDVVIEAAGPLANGHGGAATDEANSSNNIEVRTTPTSTNGVVNSGSPAKKSADGGDTGLVLVNGSPSDAGLPDVSNGSTDAAAAALAQANGPLTPPQSHNGSVPGGGGGSGGASGGVSVSAVETERDSTAEARRAADTLNEGGVPWYLNSFQLDGTTAEDDEGELVLPKEVLERLRLKQKAEEEEAAAKAAKAAAVQPQIHAKATGSKSKAGQRSGSHRKGANTVVAAAAANATANAVANAAANASNANSNSNQLLAPQPPQRWLGARDAVRSLSEALTDMDDEELNGLARDVGQQQKDAAGGDDTTITASSTAATTATPATPPAVAPSVELRSGLRKSRAATAAAAAAAAAATAAEDTVKVSAPSPASGATTTTTPTTGPTTPKRRNNVQQYRKGIRSSARRR